MLTDPIADMLTRIRNAVLVQKTEVEIPKSQLKFAIAKILEREGWIEKVIERSEKAKRVGRAAVVLSFVVRLKYEGSIPMISSIRRVSTPGRRVYVRKDRLTEAGFRGLKIVSTSRGIMTGAEAKKAGIGGELLCEIQ